MGCRTESCKLAACRYVRNASSVLGSASLGFNWYLNAWIRTQFNWERAWFDDPVRLGPGPRGSLKAVDTIAVRLQVIF